MAAGRSHYSLVACGNYEVCVGANESAPRCTDRVGDTEVTHLIDFWRAADL